jgi:hypothetical protein
MHFHFYSVINNISQLNESYFLVFIVTCFFCFFDNFPGLRKMRLIVL